MRGALLVLGLVAAACRGEESTSAPDKETTQETLGAPRKETARETPVEEATREAALEVRWVPAVIPQDASLLEAPAVVRAAPEASGEVFASVRARVERVHVQVGNRVERGAPIADVVAPDVLEAAAAYLGSSRRLALHRARAQELEALRAEGLVDKARVFEQQMQAAELQARRDEALATLRGAGVAPERAEAFAQRGTLVLRAPVAGVVAELDARPGEMRDAASGPLARIRGEGPVRIEVRTPTRWPGGGPVRLELADGRHIDLRSEPLASVVEPEAGTHVHWFAPEQSVELSDGLRGVVRLGGGEHVWEVPAGAVLQEGQGSSVFRRRADEVERVDVEVVASSGASAIVKGPLQSGDEVAADASRLRSRGADP